jgi:hypothetical protein
MAELTVENLQEIRMKFDKLGLPETFLEAVNKVAIEARGESFYASHTMQFDNEPVKIYLGFQEQRIGRFMPDLLGMSLPRNRDNVMDQNTFFLLPDDDLSIKEAYNMMKGRAVHRAAGMNGEEDYWMRLNTEKLFSGITMPEMIQSRLNVGHWLEGSPLVTKLSPEQKKKVVSALQAGDRWDLGELLKRNGAGLYLQTNPEKNQVEVLDKNRRVLNIKDVIRQGSPTLSHQRKM